MADGHLKKFITEASGLDADQRGELLLKAEGIANVHQELAQEGQSEAPAANENVNYHFIAFVHCDGGLYELVFKIVKLDAAKICEAYMKRDPDNLSFSMVALAENN
ncbi:hypothetical protein B566_EDAN005950 [Ephemera danica]|nr:hypothetical protein B566_EDAN005950 [Ephemera danica]